MVNRTVYMICFWKMKKRTIFQIILYIFKQNIVIHYLLNIIFSHLVSGRDFATFKLKMSKKNANYWLDGKKFHLFLPFFFAVKIWPFIGHFGHLFALFYPFWKNFFCVWPTYFWKFFFKLFYKKPLTVFIFISAVKNYIFSLFRFCFALFWPLFVNRPTLFFVRFFNHFKITNYTR